MSSTRAKWQAEAESELPPPDDGIGRNVAMTRQYARWYVAHRDLCKWSGMAVFASFRMGQIFALHRRLEKLGAGKVSWLRDGVDLLRRTTNRVFEDIGWAHAGYLAPEGGLGVVEDGLADLPTHARLLRGFQRIDAGRQMLRDDPKSAADAIWEGNAELLRHEQELFVQPQLGGLGPLFGGIFSATAVTNYSLGGSHSEPATWFYPDMLRHGRHLVRQSGLLPSLCDFDQRWFWIENHALPLWRRIDAESLLLRERMREIALGESFTVRGGGPPAGELRRRS